MTYELVAAEPAKRFLESLPKDTHNKVMSLLNELTTQPQPSAHPKVAPLDGRGEGLMRLRYADVRVVFDRDGRYLRIHRAGYRNDVYDNVGTWNPHR